MLLLRRLQQVRLTVPRVLQGLFYGAAAAVVVSLLMLLGWLSGPERNLLDSLFRTRDWPRHSRFASPNISILVVDDSTVERAGVWPIPRSVYADVILRLHRAGVKTIAFDVLMPSASPSAGQDAALVQACRQAGNVVQAAAFERADTVDMAMPVTVTAPPLSRPLPPSFALADRGVSCPSAIRVTSSLPALLDTAPAIGHINVLPESDGTLRRIPQVFRYRAGVYPSLALAAAAHFLGLHSSDILAYPDGLRFTLPDGETRRIPLDENGEELINWVGGNRCFPTYSFNQLQDGVVPIEALRNKLVLIGVTAAGTYEHRATPFSPVQPSVEIQATAVDNILTDRPLRQISARLQFELVFAFAMLAGGLVAPWRALGGTVMIVLLCTLLWESALIGMMRNYYLPVAAPLMAAVLSYATVTALNYRREWEANWRNEAAVSTLARGSALMALGRDRRHLYEVIETTARDALRAERVFLIGPQTHEESALGELAHRVAGRPHALVWPPPLGKRVGDNEYFGPLLARLSIAATFVGRAAATGKSGANSRLLVVKTFVAASLRRDDNPEEPLAGHLDQGMRALVALGRHGGGFFSERDGLLLDTLAEQAALALDNLTYYELLQGRIELANASLQEAYQLLSEQSAKLSAAVESIADALLITDPDGNTVFSNAASQSILRDAAPAIGDNLLQKLRGHGLAPIAELFQQARELPDLQQQSRLRCDLSLGDRASGSQRVLSAQLTPLVRETGEPLGTMLVISDVTTDRELEQLKSDFVALLAHELRSPLTTILGYASLIHESDEKLSPSDRADMTNTIMRHCRRLNAMVTELLDIARLDAHQKLSVRRKPTDLVALSRRVLDEQLAALQNGDHQLTVLCREEEMVLEVDPDRVEQVVTNLLTNAVKYSPKGGAVTVALQSTPEGARISVTDQGIGISEQQQTQLFRKFYRTPHSQLLGIKGTGLGLYLVKQLVEAHGGAITVTSELDRGTEFVVFFPKPET